MYDAEKVIGAVTGIHLMELCVRKYPLTFQSSYHYLIDWLQNNAPEKLDVFLGRITNDYFLDWSIEREQIWNACMWVCELHNRAYAKGHQPDHARIDAAIRKSLHLKFVPQVVKFDETTLDLPPQDFQFEAYLRKEAIELHGLPTFIAAVEIFISVFQYKAPRELKVAEALIFQQFIGDQVLQPEESLRFALSLAALTQNLTIWPRNYVNAIDLAGDIRNELGLPHPNQTH